MAKSGPRVAPIVKLCYRRHPMTPIWNMSGKAAREAGTAPWNALAALVVLLAAGLAEMQPARAQGDALPPDVSAAIDSAFQAGEAAAENAALSAVFANDEATRT